MPCDNAASSTHMYVHTYFEYAGVLHMRVHRYIEVRLIKYAQYDFAVKAQFHYIIIFTIVLYSKSIIVQEVDLLFAPRLRLTIDE